MFNTLSPIIKALKGLKTYRTYMHKYSSIVNMYSYKYNRYLSKFNNFKCLYVYTCTTIDILLSYISKSLNNIYVTYATYVYTFYMYICNTYIYVVHVTGQVTEQVVRHVTGHVSKGIRTRWTDGQSQRGHGHIDYTKGKGYDRRKLVKNYIFTVERPAGVGQDLYMDRYGHISYKYSVDQESSPNWY